MFKIVIELFYILIRVLSSSFKTMPAVWKKLVERSGPYGSPLKTELLEPTRVGPMLSCSSVEEWHSSQADKHQGLLVERSIDPLRWQHVADDIYKNRNMEREDSLFKKVIDLQVPAASLQSTLRKTAAEASRGLPSELAKLLSGDLVTLATVASELAPMAKQMVVKLELFGESVCARWHQDHYVLRGIVSYNMTGTEYTSNANVDFWELENCGNNDCVIRCKSKIMRANVGDLMLIKGKIFPGKAKALVHKSPAVQYDENSMVQSRLLLKVDIIDMGYGK